MPRLVALDLPGGDTFVAALRRVWDAGDAALPLDQRLRMADRRRLADSMRAGAVVDRHGHVQDLDGGEDVVAGDALVVATSGTTGEPKGVVLTHDAVVASATATSERLSVSDEDHWLACLPLSHIGGLSVVTRAIVTGTRLTVLPGFDAGAVDESEATLVSLVATALRRVNAQQFRVILLGGSRPPAVRPPNTIATYGMTETGSGVVYERRALPNVDLRVVDDEIHVRGPMLLRCYRDGVDPKIDGWFHTGDLGHIDPTGLVTIHGRRGDLIITGGENVWPEPVESIVRGMASVADVAVAGRPDDEWGAMVTAFVVPHGRQAPTLDDVRDAVKAELPAFHAPRRLVVVDHIPRSPLGKVIRARLPGPAD